MKKCIYGAIALLFLGNLRSGATEAIKFSGETNTFGDQRAGVSINLSEKFKLQSGVSFGTENDCAGYANILFMLKGLQKQVLANSDKK